MAADEMPDWGRSMALSETMTAIGRRWARSAGAGRPSRSEGTQSAGIVAGERLKSVGEGSGVGESDGEGEADGEALGVAVACAVSPGLTAISRPAATIATTATAPTAITTTLWPVQARAIAGRMRSITGSILLGTKPGSSIPSIKLTSRGWPDRHQEPTESADYRDNAHGDGYRGVLPSEQPVTVDTPNASAEASGVAPANPAKPTDLPVVRFFLLALGVLLTGYAFLGRGFAHLGVPPVYLGEVVLALGLAAP